MFNIFNKPDNKNLVKWGAVHAAGVAVYTLLVATLMQNGDKIFGKTDTPLNISLFLMLMVLSVAVVGSLVVGKPLMLYIDGKKKEALTLLGYTILFLFLLVMVGLVMFAIF